jgi:DNA-binding transcriptional regulator YiaG
MNRINAEAAKLIADLELSYNEVSRYLNVPVDTVKTWFEGEDEQQVDMPEKELYFLKYCLMSDNKRSNLF